MLLEVPGYVPCCPSDHLFVELLAEHHFDGMVTLGSLPFHLGDPLDLGLQEEVEQAGLLVALVSVLHVPAVQDVLSPKVTPLAQTDVFASLVTLDGSLPLGDNLRGVRPLLLVEPLVGVLDGLDLPLLGCHEVQLLEHFW